MEEIGGGKARIAVDRGRYIVVPLENVILETGIAMASHGELDAFRRETEAAAAGIDLREVWELVRGEPPLSFREIAELLSSDPPDARAYAAVLHHLESGASPWFDADGARYAAASEESAAERRDRAERQQREETEDQTLIDWLAGRRRDPSPEGLTPRQRTWLDRIRSWVVQGDEWTEAPRVKTFLARLSKDRKAHRRGVFDLLVERGVFEQHEHLQLLRLEVPIGFDPAVDAEAAAHDPEGETAREGRRDLTGAAAFSIDDATTTDIDDALSVTRTGDGFIIGIHITDLTLAVGAGTRLDEAARERVATHYFPDRKVPMLPPALSEGSASLVEGEERPVVSLLLDVGESLEELRSAELVRARITNRRRLTYDEVDRALAEDDGPLVEPLGVLARFAELRRRRRIEAGAVEIESPDLEVRVSAGGEVSVTVRQRETPAQRLVSEMMILYNVEAARFARERDVPLVFRAQGSADSQAVLADASLHPALARHRFFRSVPPGDLTLEPRPHHLLGVDAYCQCSSPLRRYVDLLVQRQIAHFLASGEPRHSREEIAGFLYPTEERLRELRRLEADRVRYWLLKHFEGLQGSRFEAVVLENHDRQATVELTDCPFRAGVILHRPSSPGDLVSLRLARADAWEDTVRFVEE